eukprot:6261615-Prorocentrum_lima.AAC.1
MVPGAGTRRATPPQGLALASSPPLAGASTAALWAMVACGNSPAQIPACPSPQWVSWSATTAPLAS